MDEPLRVYFASQSVTKDILREEKRYLESQGYVVQARWLDSPANDWRTMPKAEIQMWIDMDLADVRDADALVFWSMPHQHGWGAGGRHVEYGYALALNKPIVIVGQRENLFHHHSFTDLVPDAKSLPWALAKIQAALKRAA